MDDLVIAAALTTAVVSIPFCILFVSTYSYMIDGNPFIDKQWKIFDPDDTGSDDF